MNRMYTGMDIEHELPPLSTEGRRVRRRVRRRPAVNFGETKSRVNPSGSKLLITPTISQINATVEYYKQEAERHQARADLLEKKVKDLENRLAAKSAMQRQEIVRAFESIGVTALKEKIAEAFTAEIVKQTIEQVMGETQTDQAVKCEIV